MEVEIIALSGRHGRMGHRLGLDLGSEKMVDLRERVLTAHLSNISKDESKERRTSLKFQVDYQKRLSVLVIN
jgi:hypothetical protein